MDDNQKHPVDDKRIKFRSNLLSSRKESIRWIIIITILSLLLSATLSFVSTNIMENSNIFFACVVVLVIIIVSILFDIVGTAVTSADETPFHAMASRKMYAARQAIRLIRNADKVSNFCNDVVGDICGVISGTASAYIIIRILGNGVNVETSIEGLVISGLVASMTVGGKAIGKTIAISHSNYIIYKVAVIIKFFVGRISTNGEKKKRQRRDKG